MQQHYDMIKGFGVSAVGFVAWAINHAEVDKLLGTASAFFALVLLIFTIAEKAHQWRIRNRRMRRFEAIRSARANRKVIIPLLLVGMALATGGCAAPKISRHAVAGTRQVQAATVHITKAKTAGERAQQSIASGKQAAAELKRSATPAQEPHIKRLELSLADAERENQIMQISLSEAQPQLFAAQGSIDALSAKLLKAEENARDYWRLKLWIATLIAGIAAWLVWQFIPGFLGPYKWWAVGGAGATAFGTTLLIL